MANWRSAVVGCLIIGLVAALCPVLAQGQAPPADSDWAALRNSITNPTPGLSLGGDVRLREVYLENTIDLRNSADDNRHFFRLRGRVWGRLGPFLKAESVAEPNGLSAYVRMTYESRPYVQRQDQAGVDNEVPQWDEMVYDNLYVQWQRIGGMPVSLRVGRQDLVYGRGWLILDGTPLDGSRTIYCDAAKATIHLDECATTVDLIGIDNKARQTRLDPFGEDNRLVSEFDARLLVAYLINKQLPRQEFHAYWIYKDDDKTSASNIPRKGRIVHTAGALAQGRVAQNLDYYVEGAYQWGKEGNMDRRGWGYSGDLGYTFFDRAWTPRINVCYEYLTGDDPSTTRYEGWDPVLARWPQWSELYVYRWAQEELGLPGCYCNLQRFTLGATVKPTKKMTFSTAYSIVLANEHSHGKAVPYDGGSSRGQHAVAKLMYRFNKYVSGHLWGEYFHPESYYDEVTDDAIFARWELMFVLK